jgi:hypothetical protein
MLRKALLSGVALALAASAATAQVNFTPQPGITSGYYAKVTYSGAFFGLVPVTGATDVVCLAGSATKVVRLVELRLGGTVATAAISFPINLVRRVLVDSAGTPASTTANPANNDGSRDTGQATNTSGTATPISYTGNPTINDTSPVYLDSQILNLNLVSTATPAMVSFAHGLWNEDNIQPLTLRGANQQLCVNFNGVTLANAVTLNGVITWTEE